jgi:hypothetical protein
MTLVEGMGFSAAEAKKILLTHPLVYMHPFEDRLQANFDQLHSKVFFR